MREHYSSITGVLGEKEVPPQDPRGRVLSAVTALETISFWVVRFHRSSGRGRGVEKSLRIELNAFPKIIQIMAPG